MATCQICGRTVKDNTGTIANHGYTRPGGGWQTASCYGAKFPRYELSANRIPTAIEMVEKHIANVERMLAELLANPPQTLTYTNHRYQKVTVELPEIFNPSDPNPTHRFDTYGSRFQDIVSDHKKDIKQSKFDLAYLKERLEKWEYKG